MFDDTRLNRLGLLGLVGQVGSLIDKLLQIVEKLLQRRFPTCYVGAILLFIRQRALEFVTISSNLTRASETTASIVALPTAFRARKQGVALEKEPLSGSFCQFHRDGSRLFPHLASAPSPFAPLLTLQNFGYKWGAGSPGLQPHGGYEPSKESVIGPWLALPTENWSVLRVEAVDE